MRAYDRRGGDAMGGADRGGLDRRGRALRDVPVRPGVRAQRHRDRADPDAARARSPTPSRVCRPTRSEVCPGCWPTPCPTGGARRSSTPGWPRRGARSRASTSYNGSATSAPAASVRWSSSPPTSRPSPAGQRLQVEALVRLASEVLAAPRGVRGRAEREPRRGGDEGDPRRRQLRRRRAPEGVHRLQRRHRSGPLGTGRGRRGLSAVAAEV